MKKLFTLFVSALFCIATLWAQSPQKMSYQAVLRDAAGKLITNKSIGMKISILQGSGTGTEVYKEIYNPNPQTNPNGLVSLEIGSGLTLTGTFDAIDWASGPYFIKIETDPTGGTGYSIIGTSQILSTPYALYAKKAGNGFSGNYSDLSNKPNLADTSKYLKTEKELIFNASVAKGIKTADTAKWNAKSNFSGKYTDLTNKPTFTDSINKYAVLIKGDQYIFDNKLFTNDIKIKGITVGTGGGDSHSTALGYSALSSNTTGYANTAIGSGALTSNTTASYNTAVGTASLYYNTTGVNNTSMGYYALVYNTTGYSNTATGFYSLWKNTSGRCNSANGNYTLFNNTSGAFNTASGDQSLYSNSTGNTNTAFGNSSLFNNTTGEKNTAIGSSADVATGNLTNATAIGFNTIVDASNKVRIGNDFVTVIEGKVAFTNLSDRRTKKNITDLNTGLDFILKLRPVAYQMKQGDDKINYGFIAQDIEALVGSNNSILTIGGDKERTLGLRYTDFIAPMVKAMQEQQNMIIEISKQNAELKSEMAALKASLLKK